MRRMMSLGLVVACAAVARAVQPAGAQSTQTVTRDSAAIVAIEHQWIGSHDSLTLDRILAADFQHPVAAGVVLDKASHIAWMVAHPAPPSMHPRFVSLSVRVYGDAAVATGIVATADRSGHEVSRNMFTDVFVRRSGRWQAVNAEETAVPPASGVSGHRTVDAMWPNFIVPRSRPATACIKTVEQLDCLGMLI